MSDNIKQQLKLTIITFIQTLLSLGGIATLIIPFASLNGDSIDAGSIAVIIVYVFLLCVPLLLLSYIPAKFALREKGTIRGVINYESIYYNKASHRVRYGTFTDWAEFQHKINLIWFLLSPFAFIFQLASLVIAIIAPNTKRIKSEIGLKNYSGLEHYKLQQMLNLLFNFVILPKPKEDIKPVAKTVEKESKPVEIDPMEDVDDDDDDIVTLTNADGEEVDFTEIAGIAYKGNFYAILQPVELLDGMDDDEALVFKVSKGADGEDKFEIELDDDIINAVFEEYNRLLDEANK